MSLSESHVKVTSKKKSPIPHKNWNFLDIPTHMREPASIRRGFLTAKGLA